MRNVLAHAGKSGRRVVSAFIATAFAQNDAEAASRQWRLVADQIRLKVPKLAGLMDEAEPDVLAYMTFPKEHRAKLHSTNPIERLNGEIKRRTEVVGIFPNENAITRLVGAILLEQNDEWAVQRARYMTLPSWGHWCQSQAAKPHHSRNLWRLAEREARALRRHHTSERRPRRLVRMSLFPSFSTRWLYARPKSTPVSCFRSWSARGRHHGVGEIGSRAPTWKTGSDLNVRRQRHIRRRREPSTTPENRSRAGIRPRHLLLARRKAGAVHPDAMHKQWHLPGGRRLGLSPADPLRQPHAPGPQCRPFLRPVQEQAGCLTEVGSQQPIAAARHATVDICFTGLHSSRRQAEIGADTGGRALARGIVDGVAEGQCRHHVDARDGRFGARGAHFAVADATTS